MATVDLPTPPLPAATATMFLTPGNSAFSLGGGWYAVTTRGITVTRPAPLSRSAVSMREVSSRRIACGYAWVGRLTVTSASEPCTSMFETMRSLITSLPRAGSITLESACRALSTVRPLITSSCRST